MTPKIAGRKWNEVDVCATQSLAHSSFFASLIGCAKPSLSPKTLIMIDITDTDSYTSNYKYFFILHRGDGGGEELLHICLSRQIGDYELSCAKSLLRRGSRTTSEGASPTECLLITDTGDYHRVCLEHFRKAAW
ncbi:unnamed protein product [Onchocerca flexuosa]|uniref:BTB domain-containing protein n=1 Tax=Onchocerca flexuosa TaxID=387005 RepID=A0A183H8M1_9BILA|nr:unnamed protein product [Onchocerca flexuosa]